jgi:aspartyl-tRNA(Asn)/glutamyl-tRNA(Gln) amidotransferase subunit C
MGVSREDVRKMAELSRLHPGDGAVERLTDELNGILEHIRSLEDADVSSVEDSDPWRSGSLPFRRSDEGPDRLTLGAPGDRAPSWVDGFFVVPRLPALDAGGDES